MYFNNMKTTKAAAFLLALVLAVSCNSTGKHLPKAENYRSYDPVVQKMLYAMRTADGTSELNSLMIVQHGKKVLEYYDCCYGPDFMNICWSASKTFTATAVGFAVQDGVLKVEDRIIDHLKPEQLPAQVSDTLKALTIHDLLRMASGLKKDPIGPTGAYGLDEPTRTVLEAGFRFWPGERYKYNSHNTYLLSVAVQNATGKTVAQYIDEKLFKPLDIRKWHWDLSNEGYSMGGWGLYLPTESLAKMGLWMMAKGVWNGKRLLNEEWFDEAMKAQVYQYGHVTDPEVIAKAHRDWKAGYGYQMWMMDGGGCRLDGAHGQWSIIFPQYDAVVVLTGNCRDTRKEMTALREFVEPMLQE